MVYTQLPPATTASSGSVTLGYGAGTTAGAFCVAVASVRSMTATVTSFMDNAGNTWTPIGPAGGDPLSLVTYLWYSANTTSFTQLDVAFSEAVAANLTAFEFPDGTGLDGFAEVTNNSGVTPYDAVTITPTTATTTVLGGISYRANRTVALVGTDYTAGTGSSSGLLYSRFAVRENAGTSATGPQWETLGGDTPTPAALFTLGVKTANVGPDYPEMLYRKVGGVLVEQEFVLG